MNFKSRISPICDGRCRQLRASNYYILTEENVNIKRINVSSRGFLTFMKNVTPYHLQLREMGISIAFYQIKNRSISGSIYGG